MCLLRREGDKGPTDRFSALSFTLAWPSRTKQKPEGEKNLGRKTEEIKLEDLEKDLLLLLALGSWWVLFV